MIPAMTRRMTSNSLAVVCGAQGRRIIRNGNNFTVAQLGGGGLQQTRGFSRTTPSRSALNSAIQPKEKGGILKGEGKSEDPLGRPEHAVISTFDLFSIGGLCSYQSPCLLKGQT